MKWGTPNYQNLQYIFAYDGTNRITQGVLTGGGFSANSFKENYTYDKNGNISLLQRFGQANSPSIDYITYNYVSGTNRLNYASDGSDDVASVEDFPGTTSTAQNFTYDYNGNVSRDNYRNVNITYNQFNLPEVMDFGSNNRINYFYNSTGEKMLRAVSVAGATPTMTYYFGPFVHEGLQGGTSSLKYIITPEGRILNTGTDTSPVWKWEYNLTDHLGNVRVVITPHTTAGYATLLQEDNYFPFGMKMSQLSTSITTTNDYLYNGKQLQTNFNLNWYDYGARFYDPALGRWHSIDPMAELYNSCSPYAYVLNNPVNIFDPNGMYSMFFNGEEVDGDAKRNLQSRLGLPDDSNSDETSSDVETGIPTSIMDVFGKIGESIKNMMFSKTETPDGKSHYLLNDQTAAIERGPVALIISGNAAAQMYTGGVDVSLGVLLILKGVDKGAYAITDIGVPIASTGFSAGIAGKITPIFFAGNPDDFMLINVEGTRLEVNSEIPLTPILAGGFHSTGTRPQDATFGLYIGYGKSITAKGVSLEQPLQINLGYTNVLGN